MSKKTTTNEDILELLQETMQMTSDGFLSLGQEIADVKSSLGQEINEVKSGLDHLNLKVGRIEIQHEELKEIVTNISGEQIAQGNDIKELLDRLFDIEKRLPSITEQELVEMRGTLQGVVNWAVKSAKLNNVPLRFPK